MDTNLCGQMLRKQGGFKPGDSEHPLHGLQEFPHISGPVIGSHCFKKSRRKTLCLHLVALAEFDHVVHGQIFDVLRTRPEWR